MEAVGTYLDERPAGALSVADAFMDDSPVLAPARQDVERVCGLTPYAFVRQARLREAVRLLLESDFTIARVAAEAGFSDLSTFNHAFKRAFGRSPARFRAR